MAAEPRQSDFDPHTITRPDPVLLSYYLLISLLTVVGFPVMAVVLWCKYHTLKYRFDDQGVSMSWGLLFRREIHLTYRRMQDIHLTRDIFQRWMGIASIGIQTASGSSGAEMTIEGITTPEELRDFLYSQMRGVREEHEPDPAESGDEALVLLREIRDELRAFADRRTGS